MHFQPMVKFLYKGLFVYCKVPFVWITVTQIEKQKIWIMCLVCFIINSYNFHIWFKILQKYDWSCWNITESLIQLKCALNLHLICTKKGAYCAFNMMPNSTFKSKEFPLYILYNIRGVEVYFTWCVCADIFSDV